MDSESSNEHMDNVEVQSVLAQLRSGKLKMEDEIRSRPDLLKLAEGIVGPHDAEIALNEATLKAVDNQERIRGTTDGELNVWLKVIVYRECLQLRRKRNRKRRVRTVNVNTNLPELAEIRETPSHPACLDEERERLWDLLSGLTEAQFEAVSLRYFEGWAIADIARQMERSEKAVGGLLRRALDQLGNCTSPSEWSRILG